MKIVVCVKLKERKDLRKKWSEKRKEERERRRERRNKEETRETDRGVTTFSQRARPFTSA